jgi:hypothetical protein
VDQICDSIADPHFRDARAVQGVAVQKHIYLGRAIRLDECYALVGDDVFDCAKLFFAHFNLTSILAAAPLSHLARPAVGFSWIGCLNGGFGRGLFAGFFRFDINPISSLNWPEGCNGVIDGDLKVDCVAIRCF